MARVTGKYSPDDTAYLVESKRIIRKVKILKFSGDFYTVQFIDSGGGIRVRESRLFATEDEAKATIPKPKPISSYFNPWN